MSETLINWPDACVFCGDSNGTIGRTANDHWKQFKCGTEYEVVGEKTAWIQDDDCKIAALMEELAAEKQQRQAAEEETKRWMELAEHQAIGRDKLGTDLAAATKRAEDAERTVAGCRDLIATQRTRIAELEEERDALKAAIWCLDKPDDSTHQETLNMIETLWANKTSPILESLDQSRALAAAEQENARLREGIESMCRVMGTLTYADISRHWAMNRLAALLAKPKGGHDA